jgi:hypothetical protein
MALSLGKESSLTYPAKVNSFPSIFQSKFCLVRLNMPFVILLKINSIYRGLRFGIAMIPTK